MTRTELEKKIYGYLPVCSGSGAATCSPSKPSRVCKRAIDQILHLIDEYVAGVADNTAENVAGYAAMSGHKTVKVNDLMDRDSPIRQYIRGIAKLDRHHCAAVIIPKKFPEVGVTQNQIDFAKGYNQAIDDFGEKEHWVPIYYTDEHGNKQLPPLNEPVLCSLVWASGKRVYAVLKRVEEDDVAWRTVDDESEIDHSINVTHWQHIDEIRRRAGIGGDSR